MHSGILTMKRVISFILLVLLSETAGSREFSLDELIGMAMKNNKEILSLKEEREYYKGRYIEAASSYYLPYINADLMLGGPVANHKKEVSRVTDASNFGYMGIDNAGYLFKSNVDFLYPIYTFGKLGSIKDAADRGVMAAEANLEAKKIEISLRIAEAYYSYILFNNILSILNDGEKRLIDARKKLKGLLEREEGNVTEKDLYKLDYYSSELYFRISETKKGIGLAKSAIVTLCDLSEDIEIKYEDLEDGSAIEMDLNGYIKSAKEKRYEIRALKELKNSLELLARAQKRAYYPDIFIGGGLRFSHSNLDFDETNPWIRDDFNYLGFAIGLGARINLDIGVKYGKEIQSYAQFMKYQYLEEALAGAIEMQTRKVYAEYVEAKDNYETYKTGERAAKKWLTTETMNYNIGLGDTKGLIDALVAYAQSGIMRSRSAYDMKIKKITLDLYSGKIGSRKK